MAKHVAEPTAETLARNSQAAARISQPALDPWAYAKDRED